MAAVPATDAIAAVEERAGLKWEMYRPTSTRGQRPMGITISATGEITLNKLGFEALRMPPRAQLMFERGQKIIGIRAAEAKDENASALTQLKQGQASRKVQGARAFVRRFALSPGYYPARIVDGMLLMPVRDRVPSKRGGRSED